MLFQELKKENSYFEFFTRKKIINLFYGILYEGEEGNNPYGLNFQVVAKFLKTTIPSKYVLMLIYIVLINILV